jgi:hypothetical protein
MVNMPRDRCTPRTSQLREILACDARQRIRRPLDDTNAHAPMHAMSHIAREVIAMYRRPMRAITIVFAFVLTAPLAGCFVHTRDQNRTVYRESKSCPPAHHWEGGACIHNGKAKGQSKK